MRSLEGADRATVSALRRVSPGRFHPLRGRPSTQPTLAVPIPFVISSTSLEEARVELAEESLNKSLRAAVAKNLQCLQNMATESATSATRMQTDNRNVFNLQKRAIVSAAGGDHAGTSFWCRHGSRAGRRIVSGCACRLGPDVPSPTRPPSHCCRLCDADRRRRL